MLFYLNTDFIVRHKFHIKPTYNHEKRAYTESDDIIDTVLYHSISALCLWVKRQSVTATIEEEWFLSFVKQVQCKINEQKGYKIIKESKSK